MTRPTRVGLALAAFLLVVLTASGAWLWWNYRPDVDQWVRVVHQVAAVALLVVAVGLLVVAILRRRQLRAPGVVAAIGVFVTVGAAYVLGRLLAWDQLALWAVTVGDNATTGVAAASQDSVKYVIVDGRIVSSSTFEWWSYLHLVLALLGVAALLMVWLRTRERPVRPSSE